MEYNAKAGSNNLKFIDVFGFHVFNDDLGLIPMNESCKLINTISPNSYGISTKDSQFYDALLNTDYLVLDGVYFGLASIVLMGKIIKANQGPDVFKFFMNRLNEIGGKVFFLGSSIETLSKIKKRASIEYPNISVGTFSPPHKPAFSKEDDSEMLSRIEKFKPTILFVGMTAPKQEKWTFRNKHQIQANLAISIGGVFDWYAGTEPMVPSIWWKLKLGWLIRTILRPELLKRYPIVAIFFWHLFLAAIGLKKFE